MFKTSLEDFFSVPFIQSVLKRSQTRLIVYDPAKDDITKDLMALGIAKEDIVLGFHSPYMRQFTEFAVL